MNKSIMKTNSFLSMIYFFLIKTPIPTNISYLWNFGSMLGLNLMLQIITGVFLSMHYCPNTMMAFNSIIHIMQDVKYGWIMRLLHMNGASTYFILMYLHISRGIYYHSYSNKYTWICGVMIILLSMATAFMGYVLPWGQMSFWGAMVITNLVSTIPYIGDSIVQWLWGGFTISNATLNRFFTFHFIMPAIIFILVIIHLIYLHKFISNNPMGLNKKIYLINFHPLFSFKDSIGFMILIMFLMIICLQYPYMLSDPDNFIMANPMITPTHIKPEWYFLFAYAILRSIPSKFGGVMALMLSIIILISLNFTKYFYKNNSSKFYPLNQLMFWMFINSFIILTWVGGKPIEYPYMMISQIYSMMYFLYFFIMPMLNMYWDKLLYKNKNKINNSMITN